MAAARARPTAAAKVRLTAAARARLTVAARARRTAAARARLTAAARARPTAAARAGLTAAARARSTAAARARQMGRGGCGWRTGGGGVLGDARVVDVHLVHRRASELDERGQGGGLAAAGHAGEDDGVAGRQTLVEERRHVVVPSELVHLCAQKDEVVGQGRVDREDDAAAQVEPRVHADADDVIAQLELLVARGQVAGRDALGLDHLEVRVRHCEAGREGGCESRDAARPPVQSARRPKPGGNGAHCQAAADDGGGCKRSRGRNRTFSDWRGFALREGERIVNRKTSVREQTRYVYGKLKAKLCNMSLNRNIPRRARRRL